MVDESAHHSPILLFNVTGVVLEVGPPAGKGDVLIGAVVQQRAVDELGAVVCYPGPACETAARSGFAATRGIPFRCACRAGRRRRPSRWPRRPCSACTETR